MSDRASIYACYAETECPEALIPDALPRHVCDQVGAIAKAARAVWPDVVIYHCEWHISAAGLRWVRPTQLGDRL